MIIVFFLSITISFLLSYIVTPLVIKFFISRNWIEDPHVKNQKTRNATALGILPRGGGISIFLSILISSLLLIKLDSHLIAILLACLVTVTIGVIDDIKDISPKIRLVFNILTSVIVIFSGIGVMYISNPFGGIIDLSSPVIYFDFFGLRSINLVADLLAILWIVGCMNIVGWSAGVDGQLPGIVSISSFFIGLIGLKFSQDIAQWPLIIFSGIISGAYLGFLPFNISPAKILPGYSAKSLAGFLLAVLAILSGAKIATLVLLLGVPLIDAGFVIVKRIIQGRSPLQGGPDHLHHYLLKIGWNRRKIAYFYWLLTLVFGTISLFLNSSQKLYVFVGLILIFSSIYLKFVRRI